MHFEMGMSKEWQGSQFMMLLLMIKFISWLKWLFSIALVQLELNETVTDSVSLPADMEIGCIGNLAVFTAILF